MSTATLRGATHDVARSRASSLLLAEPGALKARILEFHQAGLQLAVHANGDAAIELLASQIAASKRAIRHAWGVSGQDKMQRGTSLALSYPELIAGSVTPSANPGWNGPHL